MGNRNYPLLAAGVVITTLAVVLVLRAPSVEVAVPDSRLTATPLPVNSEHSTLAEAPPALRERLLHTLLHAAQRGAANAMDQGLTQLHWRESEWLADPQAGLARLQQQCERSLSRAFADQARPQDIQHLCQQQLRHSLAHQFSLSEDQASHFIAFSQANPQPLQQFQQRSPLNDFEQPLAFFESYWAEQDALYGTALAGQVFGPQREGIRFSQRFQAFLADAGDLTLSERLNWYEQQQQAFSQRYGHPLSTLSSDRSDDLNRLIALHELDPSDDPVQRRYELRRAALGEEKAKRRQQREQRQWASDGRLASPYALN